MNFIITLLKFIKSVVLISMFVYSVVGTTNILVRIFEVTKLSNFQAMLLLLFVLVYFFIIYYLNKIIDQYINKLKR